jgi:hypothetical protein
MALAPAIDERLVAELWERQDFDPSALASLGLGLVYRGVPSDAGGPDYQEALLSTATSGLVRGDVEFHVRSSHWYAHGHDRNAAYNDVILHVVWEDDAGATVREDGELVPTLALRQQTRPIPSTACQVPLVEHPCIAVYASLSGDELRAAIQRAGTLRFEERAERFATEMEIRQPEEAFYTALLESLGYASNRETFRDLAEVVPFAWLQTVDSARWTEILLDAARLGPPGPVAPPAHLPTDAWRLTRLRPANHPARRIAGVAQVLARLGPRPIDSALAACEAALRPTALRHILVVQGGPECPIGQGRADEMVCSVLLPFLGGLPETGTRAFEIYRDYPSPPYNRWTRVMMERLLQAGHTVRPRRAIEHQGLHHLYHSHCRFERQDGCPVCG